MRHFLDITTASRADLQALIADAVALAERPTDTRGRLAGRLLINLFFEPSTRTRVSFDIAGRRLGMDVVNITAQGSSMVKGESLVDTFRTLEAMGPDVIVVRHADNGSAQLLAERAGDSVCVVNAGDGSHAHPSQALLDAVTLTRHFGDLAPLKVLIAGDLYHSRVAKSNIAMLKKLGVAEVRLAAPEALMPNERAREGTVCFDDFDRAVEGADVIMMLRIQRERMHGVHVPAEADYHAEWGLDARRLARAAPGCVVMHPGPMNRGVEITSEVADGPQSLILRQVRNGVFARMAILSRLLA